MYVQCSCLMASGHTSPSEWIFLRIASNRFEEPPLRLILAIISKSVHINKSCLSHSKCGARRKSRTTLFLLPPVLAKRHFRLTTEKVIDPVFSTLTKQKSRSLNDSLLAERGGFEQKLRLESIAITGKEDTPLMLFSKLFSLSHCCSQLLISSKLTKAHMGTNP